MRKGRDSLSLGLHIGSWVMAFILGCMIIGRTVPILSDSRCHESIREKMTGWQEYIAMTALNQQVPVLIYQNTNNLSGGNPGIDIKNQIFYLSWESIPVFSYLNNQKTWVHENIIDPSYAKYLARKELNDKYGYLFDDDWNEDQQKEYEMVVAEAEHYKEEDLIDQSLSMPASIVSGGAGTRTGTIYSLDKLKDFDFLLNTFYSVHSSTTVNSSLLDAAALLAKDLSLPAVTDEPQILVYHTHSQEEFTDYAAGNTDATIVGVGSYLVQLLTEEYGYSVIHDTSEYDIVGGRLDRNLAYNHALKGISRILEENPTIEVVIDLHRDGVREDLHLVTEVNGKPTAQIMLFNGISQNAEGPIEYLENPYREDNLSFSFQLQLAAAEEFPGLTRKIYLKGLRYNLHLRPRSILVEVGAQTNTYEEARNAMEPLAYMLHQVLSGQNTGAE